MQHSCPPCPEVAVMASAHGQVSDATFPTPDISHLQQSDYDHVYEPAEDTFLMLDALEKEYKYLKSKNPTCCLEIGSGSGVSITFLAKMLGPSAATYWCTDINPTAATVTMATGKQNKVQLEPVVTDLVQCLQCRNNIDVLIFNPPYVVTPSEEVGSHGIEASWAGGHNGREVLDRLLPWIPKLLSQDGVFYLVVIKENRPDDIAAILGGFGFRMDTIISRRSGPELLSILKFTR